jgi:Ser/Thr protein kinase RdoA (MazF antagonist)
MYIKAMLEWGKVSLHTAMLGIHNEINMFVKNKIYIFATKNLKKQKGKNKSTQMEFEHSFLRDISEKITPQLKPVYKKVRGDGQVVKALSDLAN